MVRCQFDNALGYLVAACVPVFQPLSMRATRLENYDSPRELAYLADRRMAGRCHDHQLFLEGERLFKLCIRNRLGDKSGVEIARKDRTGKDLRIACAKLENHLGMPPMVFAQWPWQPHGRRTFHRTKPKYPTRRGVLNGATRFLCQRE